MSEMKKLGIIGIGNWGNNLVRELSKIHCIKKCSSSGNLKNIRWLKKNYPSIQYVSDSKESPRFLIPLTKSPSVTPVAQKITSSFIISAILYF